MWDAHPLLPTLRPMNAQFYKFVPPPTTVSCSRLPKRANPPQVPPEGVSPRSCSWAFSLQLLLLMSPLIIVVIIA
jgi:hypothetical protein